MSLTFQQIKDSPTKQKFYSESQNKIITKSQIMNMIKVDEYYNKDATEEDNFNDIMLTSCQESRKPTHSPFDGGKIKRHIPIPCDLEELKKVTFYRDNQIHNFDCEFATGRSCICWCGEKYHGGMGIGAKTISTVETKSRDE